MNPSNPESHLTIWDLQFIVAIADCAVSASAETTNNSDFLMEYFILRAAEAKVRGDGAADAICESLAEMIQRLKNGIARLQSSREKAEAEIAAMKRILQPKPSQVHTDALVAGLKNAMRKTDDSIIELQRILRDHLAAGLPLSDFEKLCVGKQFDGADFEGLLDADTQAKRFAWGSKNII